MLIDTPLPVRTLCLPRRGNTLQESQDAWARSRGPRLHPPERGRFAIADGATESAHSGLWARLLVEEFVHASDVYLDWKSWLPPLQERWEGVVQLARDHSVAQDWFVEAHERSGAFATFLGLVVEEERWHALAVGDSCLVHLRAGHLVQSFPLGRASDFNSTPALVGSRLAAEEIPVKQGMWREARWRAGDQLWLMTDALARWALTEEEHRRQPWRVLGHLLTRPDAAFATWVERLRGEGTLRDDDVTLVAVSL
jgi:hypothetical protein